MSDTRRLEYLMDDADGFINVDKDRYDYAMDVATEEGREEPSAADELEGWRRCIDASMLVNK